MNHTIALRTALVLLVVSLCLGCGSRAETPEPEVSGQRSKLLLSEEPLGAIAVSEAKESLKSRPDLVLVGRIGAGQQTPWDEGRAMFLISDPSVMLGEHDEEHAHDHPHHDPENCPFCKQGKAGASGLTIVQFLDEQGEVLAIDARRLLGVKENQLVVVRGQGQVDSLGNLVVSADGIYLRE